MRILTTLQNIDRRYLYLVLALVIAVPIIARPKSHPATIFSEVESAYRTIDSVPSGKIVIVSAFFGPGTKAENEPQYEAILRHMFKKGIKFAVISWDPAGAEMTYKSGEALQKKLGKKYGVDWVHLGFRTGALNVIISGMAENFPQVMDHDKFGTKVKKLPAVSFVRNYKQIGGVVEITPSATVGSWIAYFTGPKKIPLVYCPTAVMSAEAYPYLDSGQMSGMLNGVMGAAQYETFVGLENEPTYAAAASWALSCALVFVIVLIVLGNVGYLIGKRSGMAQGGNRLG